MSEYIISGGRPLVGHVRVDGAKNSVLPILCACLLCDEGFVTLSNCPRITDVQFKTFSPLKRLLPTDKFT